MENFNDTLQDSLKNEDLQDIYNLNNPLIDQFLEAFYFSENNQKRSNLSMQYCKNILDVCCIINFNDINVSMNNIKRKFSVFIDIFGKSLILDEYEILSLINICMFTADSIFLNESSSKYCDKYISQIIEFDLDNISSRSYIVKLNTCISYITIVEIIRYGFELENEYIEKSIYFFEELLNVIQKGILKNQETLKSAKKVKGFNQVLYTSCVEMKKFRQCDDNNLFFHIQKFIKSKQEEYRCIEEKSKNYYKGLKNIKFERVFFMHSIINDFIAFISQCFLQSSVFFNLNFHKYEINNFFVNFVMFSAYYREVDNFLLWINNENSRNIYNNIMVGLILDDENYVKTMLEKLHLFRRHRELN